MELADAIWALRGCAGWHLVRPDLLDQAGKCIWSGFPMSASVLGAFFWWHPVCVLEQANIFGAGFLCPPVYLERFFWWHPVCVLEQANIFGAVQPAACGSPSVRARPGEVIQQLICDTGMPIAADQAIFLPRPSEVRLGCASFVLTIV